MFEIRNSLLLISNRAPSRSGKARLFVFSHAICLQTVNNSRSKFQLLQIAYYHSGGLRLNPNLYENGNVCLSLLNTWTGKGTEVWDPAKSTMLQVLVSIQGLVLNANPYFNEAGYERQVGSPEGIKNSFIYNENAFLLSCRSMLYLLHRPPRVHPLLRLLLPTKYDF